MKFSNLELALVMALKFYTSMTKGLKLKVRKFEGLIPTFEDVTGKKTGRGAYLPPHPPPPPTHSLIGLMVLPSSVSVKPN